MRETNGDLSPEPRYTAITTKVHGEMAGEGPRASGNTVKLVDGDDRVVGGLGPVRVGSAFDVPLGVFAFHDAGG